jgi:hypothetical protein
VGAEEVPTETQNLSFLCVEHFYTNKKSRVTELKGLESMAFVTWATISILTFDIG